MGIPNWGDVGKTYVRLTISPPVVNNVDLEVYHVTWETSENNGTQTVDSEGMLLET